MATHPKTAMLITKRGTNLLARLAEEFASLPIPLDNKVEWVLGLEDGKQVCYGIINTDNVLSGATYEEVVNSVKAYTAGWVDAKKLN